jgi:hypothetical protein
MERKALESTAANYPYLQGLWAVPMGFMIILTGISNLQWRPGTLLMFGILGGGLLLCAGVAWLITRYYRENYGEVTPTKSRQVRHAVAIVAWVAVLFVGANRWLFWSPDSPNCIYAAAFALATLAYYAILVGLRAHHVAIWGAVFVIALLPIWGGLGPDRDALAMFPLGLALIASGFLDQRLLVRSFGSGEFRNRESSHVGS